MGAMRIPQTRAGASPCIGRRKEDEAGAVAAAEERAKLSMLPTRNAMEAQGAGMTTAAQDQARISPAFGAYDAMTRKVADRASAAARDTAAAAANATHARTRVGPLTTLSFPVFDYGHDTLSTR